LTRTSTAIGFFLYVIKVQSSDPLHAKTNPTSCLFGSQFACAQTAILSAKPCSKNAGETSFGLQLVSKEFQHLAIQTKIEQHFGGLFHKIKVCQPIEDKILCKP
jgi:hypothetical protein